MTVEFLVPSTNASPGDIMATNNGLLLDEGLASADGLVNDTIVDAATAGESGVWGLTDLAGFGAVNSATFRVRARFVNPGSGDTATYRFRLTVGGTDYDITYDTATDENNGFTNYSITVGTFTEAQYNAATVTLTQTAYFKDMGPDGFFLDIDCFELEVDYAAGGAFPYHIIKERRRDMRTIITM